MRDYVILSDSCCDLDADLRKKYGIEYIPMRIIFGDTDIPASLDWEKILHDGIRAARRRQEH